LIFDISNMKIVNIVVIGAKAIPIVVVKHPAKFKISNNIKSINLN